VIHYGMPYDPIQGQGHKAPNVVKKRSILKSISSTNMHAIKRLAVSKTISKFCADKNYHICPHLESWDLHSYGG